ncbi:hypothetical protein LTR08_000480 [Meristemomyces frigidus]|nr:hypothetical protein LTR08_000480 [Meristemomyces frigidus]
MVLLKLKTSGHPAEDGAPPTAPPSSARAAPSPAPSVAGGGGAKIKLKKFGQTPTPATEHPPSAFGAAGGGDKKKKQPAQRKPTATGASSKGSASKKRSADDDISPLPKRLDSEPPAVRKPSVKINPSKAPQPGYDRAPPPSANTLSKIKLSGSRKPPEVRRPTLIARRKVPDRPKGVGYDSEDSEREEDPALQQGLILRMQPGDDAEKLRSAITNGLIASKEKNGLDVSLKFLTNDLRRAIVKIQGRMYAGVLVDLPCIVESMKSWDKKGWWKVADVCQMLLVLGRVQNDDEVKNYPLPREVDKNTMQYAHGLTPPMHYVRKRRFRKRVNYRETENVEEEVERLLREDDEWERNNGAAIKVQEYTQGEWDRLQNEPEGEQEQYNDELDADGELMESTEGWEQQQQEFYEEPDVDTADLEAELGNAFAEDLFAEPAPPAIDPMLDSPLPIASQAPSPAAVESTMAEDSAAETPAATPGQATQDEQSSDEDESDYDDDDSVDIVDEDAVAKAAERAQQLEEVADLEREIAAANVKVTSMTNQILKKREREKLAKLEEDLKMKRSAFGLEVED